MHRSYADFLHVPWVPRTKRASPERVAHRDQVVTAPAGRFVQDSMQASTWSASGE
uniref:Uncharacterized protein n=1 Tax=Neobacillus citreus TaxID=2833578 RepID=A0A942SX49_9BACI